MIFVTRKSFVVALEVLAFTLLLHSLGRAQSREDVEGRLKMALQIAREHNDRNLVAAVEEVGLTFRTKLPNDAEAKLRELEKKVGIGPGGWSMAGQPLFHPRPELIKQIQMLQSRLSAAMKSDDVAQVRRVTAEMLSVLGDQAGVPDGRHAGVKPVPRSINEADATKLFLDALAAEGRSIRRLIEGRLLPDQMIRTYAYVLSATNTIRPLVALHQPHSLPELDKLTAGVAGILTQLQQPEGFFPFPDLRGKNIRFGEMIDKQVSGGQVVVRDGWIVSADPDGGSQFDAGLCGTALLLAGQLHANDDWTRAGLRAADWSLNQASCSNFNYNAFSVSLLAYAFRVSGETKYLEGALKKFRIGVAPGQAPNGRWIDAHNARTVYHVIILRALGDLAMALPADFKAERAELDPIARAAIQALLDEFDAMGITVEALPELTTLAMLYPSDIRLQKAVQEMVAYITAKCSDGKSVKMGAQPHQLAAVAVVNCTFTEMPLSATRGPNPKPPDGHEERILISESFDDANLTQRNWYDGSKFRIVGDAWAGPGCIEYEWLDGGSQPTASSGARHLIEPTAEIWLRFYLKLSKGWDWSGRDYHPHFMHIMTTENSKWHGPAASHLTLYVEPVNGRLRLAATDIQNKDSPHGLTQGPLKGGYNGKVYDSHETLFTDDQWHCIEAHFKLNTLDLQNDRPNPDGVVRGWFDGKLVIEHTDVVLRSTDFPAMKFNQFLVTPYFGPGLLPHAQKLWVDELAVSTKRLPSVASGNSSDEY